jgi:Fur family ferric uptake transcriptional regulator
MSYDALIQEKGLKRTAHRVKCLEILDRSNGFLSAEEIHQKMGEVIPISTVYRVLESLCSVDLVSELNLDHKSMKVYERSHDHHAHHLICTACHKVIHIEGCPLKSYEKDLQEAYGFLMDHHSLDFYGLCDRCQKAH